MSNNRYSSLRVALVDDDEIYRDYLEDVLKTLFGCDVFAASNSSGLFAIMDRIEVDCIVIDYDIDGENGIFVAEMVTKKYPDPPPFVMLSGMARERTIVKAFRMGFSDFVLKQKLNPDELIGAIRSAVDRKAGDRFARAERERVARLSSFDANTGLHTGDFMKRRSRELLASANRRGDACAAIIIHPEELDRVGDEFGFAIRDRALRAFGLRLQKATRASDICGQYGDDRFVCLVDRDVSVESIGALCARLAGALSFSVDFDEIGFGFSARIGAALFPESGGTVELLLAAADRALAQARSNGTPFELATPRKAETCEAASLSFEGEGAAAVDGGDVAPPPSSADRTKDRRGEVRKRVLKRGKILLRGMESVVECTIRDLSSQGARVRLVDYFFVPDQFDLVFVDSGTVRPVKVRWRSAADFGVQFSQ